MSFIGFKGFCLGFFRRQLEDCFQNQLVGQGDEEKVQFCGEESSSEFINVIKGNVIVG